MVVPYAKMPAGRTAVFIFRERKQADARVVGYKTEEYSFKFRSCDFISQNDSG